MTEEEWESTDHTQRMIFSIPKPLATHRKFRLFMAACCRVALHRHRPEVLAAIDLAEQFADGRVSMTELIQMWGAVSGNPNISPDSSLTLPRFDADVRYG